MNRNEIIQQYVRINRAFEVAYAPKVQKALHTKTAKVISDLKTGGYDKAIRNLHTDTGNPALNKVIAEMYITVGLKHARITSRRLVADQKKGLGFNEIWTQFVIEYLKRHLLDKITFEVNNTTRDNIMKALETGLNSGLGIDGMVDAIKDPPFERYQAARIVRTEVNRAANVGATAQESTSGYEQQKEWIAVKDFRTRGQNPKDHASHIGLNGVKIDSGDLFTDPRNGDKLMFPGDPNASAQSTINCRCQAVYVNKRDARGELVKKRKSTVVVYPSQNRKPNAILI